MAVSNPIIAKPNGAAAVASYNSQVAQLQTRISDLQTNLTALQNQLADLLANPVVLHPTK